MEVHARGLEAAGRARGWMVRSFAADQKPPVIPAAEVFFLNDLSWLPDLPRLRLRFSSARFVLRSGGNDFWHFAGVVDTLNRNVDVVVVNSDFSFRRAVLLGIDPWRTVKLRGGVPSRAIERLAGRRGRLREAFDALHATSGRRILAVVCRMEPFKGVCEFLEELARRWNDSWYLVLAGAGRQDGKVRALLQKLFSPSDYVHLGELSHDEALETLAVADVLLSSSLEFPRELPGGRFVHTETMGRTVMEAMSLGVAVVATDVGGMRELADEFPLAIRLADGIGGIVDYLRGRPARRTGFSPEVAQAYSWTALVEQYARVFSAPGRTAYSLDYDGTLVGENDDPSAVAEFIRAHRGESFVMLNTARELDRALVEFARRADMDCVIAGNGLDIVDLRGRGRWRQWARWARRYRSSDGFLDELHLKARATFPDAKVTRAHCNSLSFRKGDPASGALKHFLLEAVQGRPYHLCESARSLKVVHDFFGKAGAAAYVRKDLPGFRLIGVGDGLEDMDVLAHCAKGFTPLPGEGRMDFLGSGVAV